MTAPITWAEATSPILWSNVGINWNTPAETGSATYAVDGGYTLGASHIKGGSISFGIDASYGLAEDVTMPLSASRS